MGNWYVAGTRFVHENIIQFCGRPFRNAGHMDTVLMENLWRVVGPDDDLWTVGDSFCHRDMNIILKTMKCALHQSFLDSDRALSILQFSIRFSFAARTLLAEKYA